MSSEEVRMVALQDIPLVITMDGVWKPPVSMNQEFFITPHEGAVLRKRLLAEFVKR